MPRRPRLDLPGIAFHLVQRGNDRQPCFRDDFDRRDYLSILHESSRGVGVEIHAYVLMNNHVHLLVSAAARGAVSRMMQCLGATYVRHFNERHGRTGTLWEGRFHGCPVDSGSYLWNCHRYVELNPVRAGIVLSPERYRWSSFGFNALGRIDPLVRPRPEYLSLAASDSDRRATYRLMFGSILSNEDVDAIRAHLRHERPLGSKEFTDGIELATGIPAAIRPGGRPRIPARSPRQENLL
jgi:putative transposase